MILFEIGSRHGTMASTEGLTKNSTPGTLFYFLNPLGHRFPSFDVSWFFDGF